MLAPRLRPQKAQSTGSRRTSGWCSRCCGAASRGFLSPDEAQREFDRTIRTVQESLGDEQKMAEHFAHWRARAAEVERDIARSERIKAEVRAERVQQRRAA